MSTLGFGDLKGCLSPLWGELAERKGILVVPIRICAF